MAKQTGRKSGRKSSTAQRSRRPADLTARRRAQDEQTGYQGEAGGWGEGFPPERPARGAQAPLQTDFDPNDADPDEPWDDDDPDRPGADDDEGDDGDDDEDADDDEGEIEGDYDPEDDEDGDDEEEAEAEELSPRDRRRAARFVRRADRPYEGELTAASYRAGVLYPLSTGGMIRLKPFSLLAAVQAEETARRRGRPSPGILPNHLLAAARKLLQLDTANQAVAGNRVEARAKGYPNRPRQQPQDEGDQSLELIQWLVAQCIASFHVVLEPKRRYAPDELYIGEIWDADQTGIVQYAMKGQTALASFRRE